MSNTLNGSNIFHGRIRKNAVLYYGPDLGGTCNCPDKYVLPVIGDWVSIGTIGADAYLENIKIVKASGLGAAGAFNIGLRLRGVSLNANQAPEIVEFLKPVTATADITSDTEALVIAPALATLDTTKKETNFRRRTVGQIVEWLKTVKPELFKGYNSILSAGAFDLCVQVTGAAVPADFAIEATLFYCVN